MPVYTVALGTPDGPVEAERPGDPGAARSGGAAARSRSCSGGAAFAAEDAGALDEVYERLGSQIGTREEQREISAGFAAAGLLLLGGALAHVAALARAAALRPARRPRPRCAASVPDEPGEGSPGAEGCGAG